MADRARAGVIPAEGGSSNGVELDLTYLAKSLVKYNASDLHLKVGRPPMFRVHGKLIQAKTESLKPEQVKEMIYRMLKPKQIQDLEKERQVDLSFLVPDVGRFRCNVYFQRSTLAAAIRRIPSVIPEMTELGLPSVVSEICVKKRGLVLVCGSTGAGKSTTLAAMIQYLNSHSPVHILTIEDPIEYVYRDLKGTVSQREIGSDAISMQDALRAGLRQDPDVIVIGEMRDPETIKIALTAAETGHLVISTLHTTDTKSSVERILNVFTGEQQNQVRMMLATNLVAVIAQRLLVRADGKGRIPACEVLVKSPTIENLILKNELDKIPDMVAKSRNYYKMQTMNQALDQLIKSQIVTIEEGLKASTSPEDLKLMLEGIVREQDYQSEAS